MAEVTLRPSGQEPRGRTLMTSTPDRSGWTSPMPRAAGTAPLREHRAARLPVQRGPAAWSAILPGQPAPVPLDGDVTADFALVGRGFAGLSAARRLLQLNPGA